MQRASDISSVMGIDIDMAMEDIAECGEGQLYYDGQPRYCNERNNDGTLRIR